MIYTRLFVGSTRLCEELMLRGPRYANGVSLTQGVAGRSTHGQRFSSTKLRAKYLPGVPPDSVSLEGYVAGKLAAFERLKIALSPAVRHREAASITLETVA